MAILVAIIAFAALGTIASGLYDQTDQSLNQMFDEVATSNENDMQNSLATLGKNQTLTPAAFGAIPTPSPVSLCSSNVANCNLTTSTSFTLSTSNGITMSGGAVNVTNPNANSTLNEVDVAVVFTMHIISADGTMATETARKSWAITNSGNYATPMGISGSQPHGVLGGGATYDDPTIGCNNVSGQGCPANSSTAHEADTRLHVNPSCINGYDPIECANAGSSIPTDAYHSATYTVTNH
jgi:hypothetical protein